MQLVRIQLSKRCSDILPLFGRRFVVVSVLSGHVCQLNVKYRILSINDQRQNILRGRCWLRVEHVKLESAIPTTKVFAIDPVPLAKAFEVVLQLLAELVAGKLVFDQGLVAVRLV